MKVTYLGSKNVMIAHGYDFSGGQIVDVPASDTRATRKFIGNRFFYCNHPDNFKAPEFYIYEIQNIRLPNDDLGNPQFRRTRRSQKKIGFATRAEAETWIRDNNGQEDKTHYIRPAGENIRDLEKEAVSEENLESMAVVDTIEGEEPVPGITLAVFRKKDNGEPYSKHDKVFHGQDKEELKKDAGLWMLENGIDPVERLLMVR